VLARLIRREPPLAETLTIGRSEDCAPTVWRSAKWTKDSLDSVAFVPP
jgi:hypothetical protein